jgi:hypothetical protein
MRAPGCCPNQRRRVSLVGRKAKLAGATRFLSFDSLATALAAAEDLDVFPALDTGGKRLLKAVSRASSVRTGFAATSLSFVRPHTKLISRWIDVFKTASAWEGNDFLGDLSSSSEHSIPGPLQIGCE